MDDPVASTYPRDLLPLSEVGAFQQIYVHKYDRAKRWANEVDIFEAPDFEEIEEWEKKVEEDDDDGEDGEEGGEDDEE